MNLKVVSDMTSDNHGNSGVDVLVQKNSSDPRSCEPLQPCFRDGCPILRLVDA